MSLVLRTSSRIGSRLGVPLVSAVIAILLAVGIFAVSYHPQVSITSASTTTPVSSTNSTSSSSSTDVDHSTSTSQSSSTISPSPCDQPYRVPPSNVTTLANGTQITESAEPAFVVGTGSTIDLCLQFVDMPFYNQSISTPLGSSWFSWPSDFPGPQPPANNVSGSASPGNISLSAGQTTVIQYKVSTGENSTGFDGLWLGPSYSFGCTAIPVAIGYLPSQVNSSDFPNYAFGLPECNTGPLEGQIIGYTGASVAYLRSGRIFNPTENVSDISVSSFPTSGGQENITFRIHVQSFSHPVTLGSPANNSNVVRVFAGNPELVPDSAGNECSWAPNNQTADSEEKDTSFNELPIGYLEFDSPTLQMSPYSSANYTFSVLISGPIATYTAMDVGIIVGNTVVSTSYLPVSVAGQLQTNAGSCSSIVG